MYKGLELFSTVLSMKIGRKLLLWVLQDTLHNYISNCQRHMVFLYFGSKKWFFKNDFSQSRYKKVEIYDNQKKPDMDSCYYTWLEVVFEHFDIDRICFTEVGLLECWGCLAKQLADRRKVFTCNNTRHSCCEWSHVYFTGIRGISVKGHK